MDYPDIFFRLVNYGGLKWRILRYLRCICNDNPNGIRKNSRVKVRLFLFSTVVDFYLKILMLFNLLSFLTSKILRETPFLLLGVRIFVTKDTARFRWIGASRFRCGAQALQVWLTREKIRIPSEQHNSSPGRIFLLRCTFDTGSIVNNARLCRSQTRPTAWRATG